MIRNKYAPCWMIDGNEEWIEGVLEDEEKQLRGEGDETLEAQYLRTDPEEWVRIDEDGKAIVP